MRRYAIALLHGFFKQRGQDLKVQDYGRVLKRTLLHIHRHVAEKWPGEGLGLDLAVIIADTTTAYAARGGGGGLFIFHEREARPVFSTEGDGGALLGSAAGEDIEVKEAQIQPGDIVVLCDPAVSEVIGARDATIILQRAADPAKASMFLSAIAERKGAKGPMTALIWEIPNYQGAAMLTGEAPAGKQPEEEGEEAVSAPEEDSPADLAKKQWLSKWRRRKE
jgi:hypothetical protein